MKPEYLSSRLPGQEGAAAAAVSGDFVFLRLQLGWGDNGAIGDLGQFPKQFERSFENIDSVLSGLGGSLSDVVRVRYPFVDGRNYIDCRRVRHRIWPDKGPPASVVICTGLENPVALGGVEAIAYLGTDRDVVPWSKEFAGRESTPDYAPETRGKVGFSPAIRASHLLFLAGQVALDKNDDYLALGDPSSQTQITQENNLRVLEQQGLGPAAAARLFNFVTYPQYADVVTTITNEFFTHRPPSTTIVATLGWPGNIIESEVMACVGTTPEFLRTEPFMSDTGAASAVRVDDLLFTGAIVGRDETGRLIRPGEGPAQIESALNNLATVLKNGGAGVSSIVSLNVYLGATTLHSAWETESSRFWAKHANDGALFPPASVISVPSLPNFEHLVQVEAIAAIR